jgi:hypothetical protein
MSTHLITGKAGYEHVKASDHGALHAAIMGGGEFVLEGGEQFACQVISNNKVRIFDGEALMQGRHIRIDRNTYEETTHDNGVQGYKRIDLVVLTYTKDEGTGVENVALEVIKGTPSENNPSVPEYVTGDILNNGELKNQMPLYKIPFDGLSIGEPVAMFKTVPTLQTMKEETDAKVDAKIAEMGEEFAALEAGIEDKIAEAGKPLSSNASDWGMIANYGEYSADAKTVGEEFAKVSDSLTADNAQAFQFAYDNATQKYGYKVKEADTDVFVPFSEEIIEETATKTVKHSGSNEVTVTFTFSNLREVIGIKSFAISGGSGYYFYIVPQAGKGVTISGNTVTLTVIIYGGQTDYSITAIGYAK